MHECGQTPLRDYTGRAGGRQPAHVVEEAATEVYGEFAVAVRPARLDQPDLTCHLTWAPELLRVFGVLMVAAALRAGAEVTHATQILGGGKTE
jgi:hypothetical protein